MWYFAYGANMDPDNFVGRRGIKPTSTEPAQLKNFRLIVICER